MSDDDSAPEGSAGDAPDDTDPEPDAAEQPADDPGGGSDRPAWSDRIVGDRMAVDQEFSPRVANSEFTSQEWGLIMTATEFRIRDPGDAEAATLVADASKVEHVTEELDDIRDGMGAMGVPGGGPSSGGSGGGGGGSGGIVGSIKSALGMGDSGGGGRDPETVLARAQSLTDEYAELLQARLETRGKWEEVRSLAADEE